MVAIPSHLRSIVDHDGAVILDINKDLFFSMNPIGAYIWERLTRGETPDQIMAELASDTGTDISIVSADVTDFLADLKGKHLVEFHA
jgi:hypothetical protein